MFVPGSSHGLVSPEATLDNVESSPSVVGTCRGGRLPRKFL